MHYVSKLIPLDFEISFGLHVFYIVGRKHTVAGQAGMRISQAVLELFMFAAEASRF